MNTPPSHPSPPEPVAWLAVSRGDRGRIAGDAESLGATTLGAKTADGVSESVLTLGAASRRNLAEFDPSSAGSIAPLAEEAEQLLDQSQSPPLPVIRLPEDAEDGSEV